MQRRIFLRGMGAAILALPLLAADTIVGQAEEKVAEKPYLIDTRPLSEGVAPDAGYALSNDPEFKPQAVYLGHDVITPTVMMEFPDSPSRYDPLGQWGFVAWKVKIPTEDGYYKQYGDWIKISDFTPDESSRRDMFEHALPLLREQMELKMHLVAPNVTLARVAVNYQEVKGYTERVMYF